MKTFKYNLFGELNLPRGYRFVKFLEHFKPDDVLWTSKDGIRKEFLRSYGDTLVNVNRYPLVDNYTNTSYGYVRKIV